MARYFTELDGREVGFEIAQSHGATHLRLLDESQPQDLTVDFVPVQANIETGEGLYSLLASGKSYELYVERHEGNLRVIIWRHRFEVKVYTEREWRLHKVAPKQAAHSGVSVITAPMPGLVKTVAVSSGAEVKAGERLVVLEAMKMENEINAPRDGRVSQVHVEAGTIVEGGKPLVTLE